MCGRLGASEQGGVEPSELKFCIWFQPLSQTTLSKATELNRFHLHDRIEGAGKKKVFEKEAMKKLVSKGRRRKQAACYIRLMAWEKMLFW